MDRATTGGMGRRVGSTWQILKTEPNDASPRSIATAMHRSRISSPRTGRNGGPSDDLSEGSTSNGPAEVRIAPKANLRNVRRLLCIGASCKDLEVGAGCTIGRIINESPDIEVWWAVLSCDVPGRARSARRAARLFLAGAERRKVLMYGFRDGSLLFQGEQVRETFEDLAATFSPELVISPCEDGQLDQRFVCHITRETFDDCTILEFELLSGRCLLTYANLYVPLQEAECRSKIERFREAYGEHEPTHFHSAEVLWSLMRLRGAECGAARFAEAFHVCRLVAG